MGQWQYTILVLLPLLLFIQKFTDLFSEGARKEQTPLNFILVEYKFNVLTFKFLHNDGHEIEEVILIMFVLDTGECHLHRFIETRSQLLQILLILLLLYFNFAVFVIGFDYLVSQIHIFDLLDQKDEPSYFMSQQVLKCCLEVWDGHQFSQQICKAYYFEVFINNELIMSYLQISIILCLLRYCQEQFLDVDVQKFILHECLDGKCRYVSFQ